eukprot:TRINITY_DN5184_c1_g2_i1.p1 TRINITY_DN5184_c1_g2~~TRINITY_DN5184_c1_g2_i1.p1  ORF type:complete len:795 (+),score=74.60 TRINITY_DN5184_c1_g2_i1:185-2569(+)
MKRKKGWLLCVCAWFTFVAPLHAVAAEVTAPSDDSEMDNVSLCDWKVLPRRSLGCPAEQGNFTSGQRRAVLSGRRGGGNPSGGSLDWISPTLRDVQAACVANPQCIGVTCYIGYCSVRLHPRFCQDAAAGGEAATPKGKDDFHISVWDPDVVSVMIAGRCRAAAQCRTECYTANESLHDNRCSSDCDCDGLRWCSSTKNGWCQGRALKGQCREGAVCHWSEAHHDTFLPCYADGDTDTDLRSLAESQKRCVELGADCAGITCSTDEAHCTVRDPTGCSEGSWLLPSASRERSYVKTCCQTKEGCAAAPGDEKWAPSEWSPIETEWEERMSVGVVFAWLCGASCPLLVCSVVLLCKRHRKRKRRRRGTHEELRWDHGAPDTPSLHASELLSVCASVSNTAMNPACAHVDVTACQRGKLLGAGSFGKVYVGIVPGGRLIAVKVLNLAPGAARDTISKMFKEVEMLSALRHPHIVLYLGASVEETNCELQIFMEYLGGGSLGAMVRKLDDRLHEDTAAGFLHQVLDALEFIHELGLVHRDIKGDNVLLSREGVAKLADFGCARRLAAFASGAAERMSSPSAQGTVLWMAPEVLRADHSGDAASDVWSTGCLTVELVNRGRPPWPQFENTMQAMYAVAHWAGPGLPGGTPLEHMSPDLVDFVSSCLDADPAKRLPCAGLRQHSWLRHPPQNNCDRSSRSSGLSGAPLLADGTDAAVLVQLRDHAQAVWASDRAVARQRQCTPTASLESGSLCISPPPTASCASGCGGAMSTPHVTGTQPQDVVVCVPEQTSECPCPEI